MNKSSMAQKPCDTQEKNEQFTPKSLFNRKTIGQVLVCFQSIYYTIGARNTMFYANKLMNDKKPALLVTSESTQLV